MEKSLYTLKLHESLYAGDVRIQRVPGGWNYIYSEGIQHVKLNNEFQNKKIEQLELKPAKFTLVQRKEQFKQSLSKYVQEYGDVLIVEFIDYWTEHGENDRKMRFEKETSFNISRRLKTWSKRSNKPITKNDSINDKWKK